MCIRDSKEANEFRNHLELETVSETREQYVSGELFEVGDTVVIKESEEIATVSVLGANYVIVEISDGKKMRKWLDAVELVEKQDPDIKDREGTQQHDTTKVLRSQPRQNVTPTSRSTVRKRTMIRLHTNQRQVTKTPRLNHPSTPSRSKICMTKIVGMVTSKSV